MAPVDVVTELGVSPGRVARCYAEYMRMRALPDQYLLCEVGEGIQRRHWKRAHRFTEDEPLHPEFVLHAIQYCALIPELRAKCEHAVRVWQAKQRQKERRGRPAKEERALEEFDAIASRLRAEDDFD